MATAKQRSAARRNIKKAAAAAPRKRTLTRLSAETRKALGKEGAQATGRRRGESHGSEESPSLGRRA
jgi:hypothetical protein